MPLIWGGRPDRHLASDHAVSSALSQTNVVMNNAVILPASIRG